MTNEAREQWTQRLMATLAEFHPRFPDHDARLTAALLPVLEDARRDAAAQALTDAAEDINLPMTLAQANRLHARAYALRNQP